ncbi:hypothetical protein FA15DRAFT_670407 [Coprinopsis marcescibilis]|uniref:GATA-type domain-containing protein n=1 Tax=Coprinopsis marcescibilis TaxID=230819 RepID=A0A5C3KTJ3_COPMA|nr:hypothetical protein FA15DRAFT_670407 [Coprinopsis marcescibilis]
MPSKRYGWGQEHRRSPADLHSGNNFQQAFLSDCRTTISPVDSPAYQSMLLPGEMTSMPAHSNHVPRGLGFTMDSGSSTDSDDSEPTASGQWNNYNYPYNGRTSPHTRYGSRSSTSSPDWQGLNLQIPTFESQATWNSMLLSAQDSAVTPFTPQQTMINNFVFPQRFSPIPSPSPPPIYNSVVVPSVKVSNTSLATRGNNRDTNGVKKCSHCEATSTPLWRRDPSTFKPLCNACGLYLQQRNRLRPQELIDADNDSGDMSDESDQNYVGPECSHCRTHHTSVWRRSKTGAQLCNACGVYQRLRGKPRPLSLKRNKIKPRTKHPKN